MKKKNFIKYLSCFGFTILIGVVYFFTKEVYSKETIKEVIGCASDIFLIAGLLLSLAALMTLMWAKGVFDGIIYAFKSLKVLFIPSKTFLKERKTYYDYKKETTSKGRIWKKFLLYSGLIDIAIAIVVDIIFLFM